MILAFIFILLLCAVMSAWLGKRQPAIVLFSISLVIATVFFINDITTATGISL